MPDFKCVACRIRLRSHGGDAVWELCPVCEAPLELAGELSELVGFRSVDTRDGADGEAREEPVSYLTDRREARIEELRVAAQRWLDEGGSFDTEAVAAVLEPPAPWIE